jgi:hypothetical protein
VGDTLDQTTWRGAMFGLACEACGSNMEAFMASQNPDGIVAGFSIALPDQRSISIGSSTRNALAPYQLINIRHSFNCAYL